MRTYVAFMVGAGLLLVSLVAVLLLRGGSEAAAAGFAVVLGPLVVGSFIVLLVAGERGPRTGAR